MPQSIVSFTAGKVKLRSRGRAPAVILLPMEIDPASEWQRLTEVYREKYDEELLELAADSGDLTEIARSVLADEMKRRKLSLPQASASQGTGPNDALEAAVREQIEVAAPHHADAGADGPHEYTWKVELCECSDSDEASAIYTTLERAGIQSFVEEHLPGGARIAVAADQLDQARAILAQPIPQDIVAEAKTEVPEYVPPVCPACGAADPVLESADPVNAWECEQCGAHWTDAAEEPPELP